MKKVSRIVLGIVEVGTGVLFLANQASDIQLGFGLVFVFLGLSAFVSVMK